MVGFKEWVVDEIVYSQASFDCDKAEGKEVNDLDKNKCHVVHIPIIGSIVSAVGRFFNFIGIVDLASAVEVKRKEVQQVARSAIPSAGDEKGPGLDQTAVQVAVEEVSRDLNGKIVSLEKENEELKEKLQTAGTENDKKVKDLELKNKNLQSELGGVKKRNQELLSTGSSKDQVLRDQVAGLTRKNTEFSELKEKLDEELEQAWNTIELYEKNEVIYKENQKGLQAQVKLQQEAIESLTVVVAQLEKRAGGTQELLKPELEKEIPTVEDSSDSSDSFEVSESSESEEEITYAKILQDGWGRIKKLGITTQNDRQILNAIRFIAFHQENSDQVTFETILSYKEEWLSKGKAAPKVDEIKKKYISWWKDGKIEKIAEALEDEDLKIKLL